MTLEAVIGATPANFATSRIVGMLKIFFLNIYKKKYTLLQHYLIYQLFGNSIYPRIIIDSES